MERPDFKIKPDGAEFVIVDSNGMVYGPVVSTRKEAEDLKHEWIAYYERPLYL